MLESYLSSLHVTHAYKHVGRTLLWLLFSLWASFLGALAAGREKEGELATTSLEFEYLHRKSPYKMLICGDDISNDVITFGTYFSMFAYILAHFRFLLIGWNLTAQSTGSHRGIGSEIQIASSPSFPTAPQERPGELARMLAFIDGRPHATKFTW